MRKVFLRLIKRSENGKDFYSLAEYSVNFETFQKSHGEVEGQENVEHMVKTAEFVIKSDGFKKYCKDKNQKFVKIEGSLYTKF